MQAILWKSGQIYVSNIYCDAFSVGFHICITIANNMMQITFLQTSTIVDLIFKLIISFLWSKMFYLEHDFWEATRVTLGQFQGILTEL